MTYDSQPSDATRVLVKLRGSAPLGAAESGVNLRPLYAGTRSSGSFELDSDANWFLADLPTSGPTPWDTAHAQLAARLGVDDSDVLFAEPDLVHDIYRADEIDPGAPFAVGDNCGPRAQDGAHGKAVGPDHFAWHLDDDFSQLGSARAAVTFTDPRTRIAHVDTGYYRSHVTVPEHVLRDRERSFAADDGDRDSAEDPDNRVPILDNSGHGTGTLSILAGGRVPAQDNSYVGGAPQAEVIPLRVADRVALLRTSALAQAFDYAVDQLCDVVSLSMGGLPSRAWAEAVDRAYERGVCICAAAGNHIGIFPPRTMVYPARFPRVLAVSGVMADRHPYAGLLDKALEGSFGPESAMTEALAAFTPNIPWAVFGCTDAVRLDGQGTSAATPQVAAAAALWLEHYKDQLPRDWRRVEAVRHALFLSATNKDDAKHFGNGVLQAGRALEQRPVLGLAQSAESRTLFSLFRLVTGLGLEEPTAREEMFNLELAQRWLTNEAMQKELPDPGAEVQLEGAPLRRFLDAILSDEGASTALRLQVAARYPVATGTSAPSTPKTRVVVPEVVRACDAVPTISTPPHRRLRVYAVDPSLSTRLDSAELNDVTLRLPWEQLGDSAHTSAGAPAEEPAALDAPAPLGEYFDVDDSDPAERSYGLVNLDDPRLIAQDGWSPSEGNPHFHQQMVYAIARSTVEHFERALGRPVLWRPTAPTPSSDGQSSDGPGADEPGRFRQRLTLRPHALRAANAYYSPDDVALLFGYFDASSDDPGDHWPGSRVYSCLSHDIIAHETTHAVLDGMNRRLNEPTNPDVLALHEGFADIVALMQHFTLPGLPEHEIGRTRGNLEAESLLGSLAVQFGHATGQRGALRDAIGRVDDQGRWAHRQPDPAQYGSTLTPHARGSILVAAVFDAFLSIYSARTADLIRLATGGTGELTRGAIHPDLVRRLADEAATSASHVLTMAIRAVDYLPPVDVTFFEYLRALITADYDLVSDDRLNYRVAFVDAFRRHGIYPQASGDPTDSDPPRTLSVDTLRWREPEQAGHSAAAWNRIQRQYRKLCEALKPYADRCTYISDRSELFELTRRTRGDVHRLLTAAFRSVPAFAEQLGIDRHREFSVEELRRASRVGPDGRQRPQLVVSVTQVREVQPAAGTSFEFRGGCTLVVDLVALELVYCIRKRIDNAERQRRAEQFRREIDADPLRALFFSADRREPFAALHSLLDIA